MADHPRKSKERLKEPTLTAEERELFLNAFFQGEVEPTGKYAQTPKPTKESKGTHRSAVAIDDAERELFLRAMSEGLDDTIATHHKGPSTTKEKRLIQAKKRKLVDAEIDLHGLSAEDAIFALHRFIEREQRSGSKTILVVHGKGAGILKNAVWSAVDAHPLVDDFQIAAGRLGGQGAIVVRINRKNRNLNKT